MPHDTLYRFTHGNADFETGEHWPFFATMSVGLISLMLLVWYLWSVTRISK
jgi:hypothetical protein